jgi:hypothetical protein
MQLTQFVVGISGASLTYYYEGCASREQKLSLGFVQVYAVGLIFLFYDMYKNKYNGKAKGKGSKKKN